MTEEQIQTKITELEAEKQTQDTARVEAERQLAIKQAEIAEFTRQVTAATWEGSDRARELERYKTALEIIQR